MNSERERVTTDWSDVLEKRSEFAVEVRNVSRAYEMGSRKKRVKVQALKNINLRFEMGYFIVLMGPSGSGKTTLLNMIGGLDTPTTGTVLINGLNISRADRFFLNLIREESIGYIHQTYNLIPLLSALENVALPMEMAGIDKKDREKRALTVLERVGLMGRTSHKPYELSGGEQQRVGIARALVFDPPIVLADEPTANLDTKTGKEVVEMMLSLKEEEGVTFIVATHDPLIEENADIVVHMRDGAAEREEIRVPGMSLAQSVTLKPTTPLPQPVCEAIRRCVHEHITGLTLKEGEEIRALNMPFRIARTSPGGMVRVAAETTVDVVT